MTDENTQRATISISYDEKRGQWVCDIRGSDTVSATVASAIFESARQTLNQKPRYRNILILRGEELTLLH
jgi:hypothetical protein